MDFLLYGAYGYTGRLITKMAADYGLKPLLAGRRAEPLRELAAEYHFDWVAFELSDTSALHQALHRVPVVLHAAGPFAVTAQPMIEACLETKTHYLDITGEISVFEMAYRFGQAAEQNDIMLMPGVGFDVVPTDCLARYLHEQLPTATHLQLAFAGIGGGASHGTAKTMIDGLGYPGAVRRHGKIVSVPQGYKTMQVPFAENKTWFAMTLPWGDVSTAYHTTGIPNVVVYMAVKPDTYRKVKWQRYFGWLLRQKGVKRFLKRQVEKRPPGPREDQLAKSRSYVWGRVTNLQGESRAARMVTPGGYLLTAMTSLMITKRVGEGRFYPGFQTPAGAYGADFILTVPGVTRQDL